MIPRLSDVEDLMLPMGTIVTVCMFIGLAAAAPPLKKLPMFIRKVGAWVVLTAGLWNVLWYGVQHYSEFWGIAALGSGGLMIVVALYVLAPSRLPDWLRPAKPFVLSLLLLCAMFYAITIARL